MDSNSPAIWDLEDGQRTLFVFTSSHGVPHVSSGTAVERLGGAADISLLPHPGYGVWMEAIVSDDVDTWYGFYHNEWPATRCGREDRMVSRIGAAKSTDRGRNWQDLGAVIQAPQSATACESNNRYIIGGVGDLSVMLDADKKYLYFFYSQYQRQPDSQGVAIARMVWADRDRPVGRLELWRDGIWDPEAGRRELLQTIPGSMRRRLEWTYPAGTPLVPPTYAWHDTRPTGRRVLGTVGALEHGARAIRDAAQSSEGRELLDGRHLRVVLAGARRSVAVDAAGQDPEWRQVVPAGHWLIRRQR